MINEIEAKYDTAGPFKEAYASKMTL